MRKLLFRVLEQAQVVWVDAEVGVPSHALFDPVIVPLLVGSWLYEEFHLHLLELASSEDEVTRGDFVAKRLADLADAEWGLHARRTKHVGEVYEDTLSGFWAKKVHSALVFNRSEVSFQKTVEHFRFGPRFLGSTVWARNLV